MHKRAHIWIFISLLAFAPTLSAEEAADKSLLEAAQDQKGQSWLLRVNRYLEKITHLEGRFFQTNANGTHAEGRFYIRRPWRMRFQYAEPSELLVVADGTWLVIQESARSSLDRYPLASTPLRFLLAKKPDLAKAARLLRWEEQDDRVFLELESRLEDAPGKLALDFDKKPFALAAWTITDPQGLRTRVVLRDVVEGRKARNTLFQLFDKDLRHRNRR